MADDETGELFERLAGELEPEPEPEPEPVPGRPRRRKAKVTKPATEAQTAARRANIAKARSARTGQTITPAALRKSLTDTIRSASGAMSVAGIMVDPRLLYDAEIIASKAEELAAELVSIAEKSPPMYAALVTLIKGSAWAKLGGLVVSIIIPIAANHGLLPLETTAMVGAPMPPPRPVRVDTGADGPAG